MYTHNSSNENSHLLKPFRMNSLTWEKNALQSVFIIEDEVDEIVYVISSIVWEFSDLLSCFYFEKSTSIGLRWYECGDRNIIKIKIHDSICINTF